LSRSLFLKRDVLGLPPPFAEESAEDDEDDPDAGGA